jgi:hypothetical protein
VTANWIEHFAASKFEIEYRHVHHEPWIAGPPAAAACSTRAMRRTQTKSMNKLGDPASFAKLAALRARCARIVPATASLKPAPLVARSTAESS